MLSKRRVSSRRVGANSWKAIADKKITGVGAALIEQLIAWVRGEGRGGFGWGSPMHRCQP